MKYALPIIDLLIAAPYYFASETGPQSILCAYDRIGRSAWHMISQNRRTGEQIARDTAADSNCR
jgi:hypothetical protein